MSTAVVFLAKPTVPKDEELNRKTRLAGDPKKHYSDGIGRENSEAFCKMGIGCIIQTLQSMSEVEVTPFVAIGDEHAATRTDPEPLWEGIQRLYTGEGGLGDRQHHVFEQLKDKRFDNVIIIASDIPQLSAGVITKAINALQTHDVVFGKTAPSDGGYYLFGAKKNLDLDTWQGVEYSKTTTANKLIAAIQATGKNVDQMSLPCLNGVNYKHELPAMIGEMPQHKSPKQQELVEWYEKLSSQGKGTPVKTTNSSCCVVS